MTSSDQSCETEGGGGRAGRRGLQRSRRGGASSRPSRRHMVDVSCSLSIPISNPSLQIQSTARHPAHTDTCFKSNTAAVRRSGSSFTICQIRPGRAVSQWGRTSQSWYTYTTHMGRTRSGEKGRGPLTCLVDRGREGCRRRCLARCQCRPRGSHGPRSVGRPRESGFPYRAPSRAEPSRTKPSRVYPRQAELRQTEAIHTVGQHSIAASQRISRGYIKGFSKLYLFQNCG